MKKSDFLGRLACAADRARGLADRGLPIYLALVEEKLLPTSVSETISSDAELKDNSIYQAVHLVVRTQGRPRPPYTELAIAETAWEAYVEASRVERQQENWNATKG